MHAASRQGADPFLLPRKKERGADNEQVGTPAATCGQGSVLLLVGGSLCSTPDGNMRLAATQMSWLGNFSRNVTIFIILKRILLSHGTKSKYVVQ